ncbi:MAG: hypothetical protein AB7O26_01385 [Planctomycetaceae bacterium]
MDSRTARGPCRNDVPEVSYTRTSLAVLRVAIFGTPLLCLLAPTRADEPAASRQPVEAVRPVVSQSAPEAPKYLLQYKFRPGQDVYYRTVHTTRITTQKNETSETTHNDSNALKHFRVVSVDANGTAVLESYLDKVKMSYRFGDNPAILFDSESSSPTPRGFGEIQLSIGRPLSRTTVERNGKLKTIISLAEQREGAPKGASDDRSRNFLFELPSEPIAVGKEWLEKLTVKVQISKGLTNNVVLLRKFKLESVENGQATISVRSDLLTPTDDPHILAQLIQRTPRGSFVFDIEQGLITQRTMTTNKTEVGVMGPNSAMRALSELNEKLARGPVVAEKVSLNNSPKATATE